MDITLSIGITLNKSAMSCGVYELYGVSFVDPKTIICAIWNETKDQKLKKLWGAYCNSKPAYILFSDLVYDKPRPTSGHALATYIEENKLGTITASPKAINSNTGSFIGVWIWTVDWTAMELFCKAL